MRVFIALLAVVLVVQPSLAQPLAPGKPAGVHEAKMSTNREMEVFGAGALILTVVGVIASRQSSTVNSQSFPSQQIVASTTTTG